jgi:hypothetical protein
LLLEHDANPNYAGGQALLRAAERRQQAVIDLLLPLVDAGFRNDILTHLRNEGGLPAVIKTFENTVSVSPSTPSVQEEGGYSRVNAHTLAETQTLPGGVTLTTVYNFAARQQQFFLSSNEPLSQSPPAPVNFDNLPKGVEDAMRAKLETLNGRKKTRVSADLGNI